MRRRLVIATICLILAATTGCSTESMTAPTSSRYALLLAHVPSSFEIDAPRLTARFSADEARRQAAMAQEGVEKAFAAEAARVAAEAEAAAVAAAAAAQEEGRPAAEGECIGYGCSPEQDAELNQAEQAANEDYGPGCNYQLCGEPGSGFPPFACDAGPNGLPVCEGEVPASVGPYYTPDGTLVGG
jgi:hypothetical protein